MLVSTLAPRSPCVFLPPDPTASRWLGFLLHRCFLGGIAANEGFLRVRDGSRVWPRQPQQKTAWFQGQMVRLLAGAHLTPHLPLACVSLWLGCHVTLPARTHACCRTLVSSPGPPRREQGRSEWWFSSKIEELARELVSALIPGGFCSVPLIQIFESLQIFTVKSQDRKTPLGPWLCSRLHC